MRFVVEPTDLPQRAAGVQRFERRFPSWLSLPPNAEPPPPVETRTYPLPIGQLTWENFERLCVRIAELEADVEYCRQYGVRGQDQEGIDLFAWERARNSYTVYQCKRVNGLWACGYAQCRGQLSCWQLGRESEAFRFVFDCESERNDHQQRDRATNAPFFTKATWRSIFGMSMV